MAGVGDLECAEVRSIHGPEQPRNYPWPGHRRPISRERRPLARVGGGSAGAGKPLCCENGYPTRRLIGAAAPSLAVGRRVTRKEVQRGTSRVVVARGRRRCRRRFRRDVPGTRSPHHEHWAVGARLKRHHRGPTVRTGASVPVPALVPETRTESTWCIRRMRRGGRSDHEDQQYRTDPDREL